jgi:hypothetical protein
MFAMLFQTGDWSVSRLSAAAVLGAGGTGWAASCRLRVRVRDGHTTLFLSLMRPYKELTDSRCSAHAVWMQQPTDPMPPVARRLPAINVFPLWLLGLYPHPAACPSLLPLNIRVRVFFWLGLL